MYDASYFLQILTGQHRRPSQSRVDELRARLDSISEELEELEDMAEPLPDQKTLFDRYLAVLHGKCDDIESDLDTLDPNCDAEVERIQDQLREARQRLRIARRASKAHFESLAH